MHRHSAPKAFTLVELLVVIAIIGTLMGLLLPAVQSAREAGRRNTCNNNLSQLGKAVVHHDTSLSTIPGWKNPSPFRNNTTIVNPGTTIYSACTSWPVPLLPYLERRDIYKAYETGASNPTTFINIFVCPSSPPDSLNIPVLAYVGNVGTAGLISGTFVRQLKADGVLIDATTGRTSLDAVSSADGTATTLLFSEKCGASVSPQGFWNTLVASSTTTNPITLIPPVPFPASPGFSTSALPGFGFPSATVTKYLNNSADASGRLPSSNHPGGCAVVYCDGHTGFLKDSIEGRVYGQLLTSDSQGGNTSAVANSLIGGYLLSEGDFN